MTERNKDYDDFLDSVYEEIDICGYKYMASDALFNVDPTAYRCGMADWESFREEEEEND